MISKKHIYSLKPIRRDYTYTVYEIAEIYKIVPDTVFRWVRNEGLKRIEGSKQYFVHGSELLKFIKHRNAKHKKPCEEGEMYCCKCRKPQRPKLDSLQSKKIANKTIRVSGRCAVCSTRMNTIVSAKKWTKKHTFYPSQNVPIKPHSGERVSQRKCQTGTGEQFCLNITP